MSRLRLAIACWNYDRTAALADGSVHRYLAYGFIGLLGVLIVVGLTG